MAAITGVIVKGISGFYYVNTGETVYQCKARGLFRKNGETPLVGDTVRIEVQADGDAWITEIQPRKNEFARPPIANVEAIVLVLASARPDPAPLMIDRLLVMAEEKHAGIAIVINKQELAPESVKRLTETYQTIYPVFPVSASPNEANKNPVGLEPLKSFLNGKIAALTGPSGVGKSTIINCLTGLNQAETGQISERLGRGKQTTRHAELFKLPLTGAITKPTYLFDTPGFTALDLEETGTFHFEERELGFYFPEFEPCIGACRFDNCLHKKEPGCAVRDAVKAGKIQESRYASYLTILEELKQSKRY